MIRPRSIATVASLLAAACGFGPPKAVSVQFSAQEATALPAKFVNRLILVDVTVDGAAVPPFLLDTGSDVSVIDKRTRGQFVMRPEAPAVARGAGGSVNSAFVRAKRLDAGPIRAEAPVFLVLDLSKFERVVGRPIGGILGLDILDGLALDIDYPAGRVRVAPSGTLKVPRAATVALERRGALLGMPVEIEGMTSVLLLDSGMTGALALDAREGTRRGIRPDPRRASDFRVGIGGNAAAETGHARTVRVGDRTLVDFDVVLEKPAGPFDGAIGAGILHFFRCVVDLGEGTIQFQDEPGDVDAERQHGSTGMAFEFRFDPPERGWRVASVRGDSPAARAGIRAGDVVTAIRGIPVKRLDWRRVRGALTWREDELRVAIETPDGDVEKTLRR